MHPSYLVVSPLYSKCCILFPSTFPPSWLPLSPWEVNSYEKVATYTQLAPTFVIRLKSRWRYPRFIIFPTILNIFKIAYKDYIWIFAFNNTDWFGTMFVGKYFFCVFTRVRVHTKKLAKVATFFRWVYLSLVFVI